MKGDRAASPSTVATARELRRVAQLVRQQARETCARSRNTRQVTVLRRALSARGLSPSG